MNRKLLATAICASLFAAGAAYAAQPTPSAPASQDQNATAQAATTTAQQKKKEQTLQTITVTGSLIPTAQIETATPVIRITAQDIKQQGFTNIYEALRAQPLSTGQVQGEQFAPGFTPGARTISLLGLPPDFTLFMVDGHPMAEYPLLYNGEISFTNIASIPLAMIDRIEIVPGNESSIYGSAAIAGVVNIILKQHQQGVDFNYQAGGYADGGGYSQRLQLVGGFDHNKLSLTYGFQYADQQPIWAFQRSLTDSTFSNPNPYLRGVPAGTFGIYDYNMGQYVDPNTVSTSGCGAIGNQYHNTTGRFAAMNPGAAPGTYVPTGGYLCGSPYEVGYQTLQNESKSASGYLTTHYQLNDNTQLYANLLYNYTGSRSAIGTDYIWWEPNVNAFYSGGSPGVIYNLNTGTYQNPFRLIAPEESGSISAGQTQFFNKSFDFWGGVQGNLGQTNWAYNAYLARSQNNLISKFYKALTAPVDAFFQNQFLGPELGVTSGGIPEYKPNYNNFFQNITPAEYQSFQGLDRTDAETYTQNANLQVTNDDLFDLPAGAVGVAGILQYGDQKWTLPANPLLVNHEIWGETGSSGGGTRDNYAAALEFRVPIFKMLSVDASARFDHFHNDGGGTSSRPTYKVAFSLRPLDTLLLRANYSTAFRMPDMGYVFVGPSGYFATVTDYYQCEIQHPGTPFNECSGFSSNTINPEITGTQVGNPFLKPITAKSWGGGVVWSPTTNFDVKADYYDIRISNEVQYQSTNTLLLDDAQCLLGQIPLSSPLCETAFSAISRAGATAPTPYLLLGITTHPINIARERVNGIIASADYKYDAGRFGTFGLRGQYNITLTHTLQLGPGDPTYDLLHDPFFDYEYAQGGSAVGPEFKSIVTGTLTWSIGKWTSALTAIRDGKLPNAAIYSNPTEGQSYGAATLPPWIRYNATVKYDIASNLSVTATVNNLFDAMPPVDKTQTGWPYYDFGAYNPFGRSYFVDLDMHF